MDKIEDLQVSPGKILVKIWSDKDLEEKAKNLSTLVLSDEQRNEALTDAVKGKIGSVLLMKATIINLGPKLDSEMDYKIGDHVYVFPKTFDSDFVLDGVRYLIYSERNIQAKVRNLKIETEILSKSSIILS